MDWIHVLKVIGLVIFILLALAILLGYIDWTP